MRRLNPVSYRCNGLGDTRDDGRTYHGLVAQDTLEIMPEMVAQMPVKLHAEDQEKTPVYTMDCTVCRMRWSMRCAARRPGRGARATPGAAASMSDAAAPAAAAVRDSAAAAFWLLAVIVIVTMGFIALVASPAALLAR